MNQPTTQNEILQRIPHRPPMLLLDRIVERTDQRILCSKLFSADEYFVQGHFPNYPIVPGVILCECCLQAGAVLVADLGSLSTSSLPVATRMDGVKFKKTVRPGDNAQIEVVLNDVVSKAYYMTGKVLVCGALAARLDFTVSVVELD